MHRPLWDLAHPKNASVIGEFPPRVHSIGNQSKVLPRKGMSF